MQGFFQQHYTVFSPYVYFGFLTVLVGILVSFWDGLFSVAMLVSESVDFTDVCVYMYVCVCFHILSKQGG